MADDNIQDNELHDVEDVLFDQRFGDPHSTLPAVEQLHYWLPYEAEYDGGRRLRPSVTTVLPPKTDMRAAMLRQHGAPKDSGHSKKRMSRSV